MTGRVAFDWLTAALVLTATGFSWILAMDPTACALTNVNVRVQVPTGIEGTFLLAGLVRAEGRRPATCDLPLSAE